MHPRKIRYHQINMPEGETFPILKGYYLLNHPFFYTMVAPEYYEELASANALFSSLNIHWKAHVSCAADNLAKTWDLIIPLLQVNNCPAFKCIKLCTQSATLEDSEMQRGVDMSQFTIYIPAGEEEKYNALLHEIDQLLDENNIAISKKCPPGAELHPSMFEGEKRVGIYTSVRYSGYDYGHKKQYISAEEAISLSKKLAGSLPAYNLSQVSDPFTASKIYLEKQSQAQPNKSNQLSNQSSVLMKLQQLYDQKKRNDSNALRYAENRNLIHPMPQATAENHVIGRENSINKEQKIEQNNKTIFS